MVRSYEPAEKLFAAAGPVMRSRFQIMRRIQKTASAAKQVLEYVPADEAGRQRNLAVVNSAPLASAYNATATRMSVRDCSRREKKEAQQDSDDAKD